MLPMTINASTKFVEGQTIWPVGWLFNGTSTQKGQFVPIAREGTGSVGFKDGQRDTMHIILRYTITKCHTSQ